MAPPINANHQRTATEIRIVAINIRHCQDHHTRNACFHVGSTVANVTASGSAVGPGGSLVGQLHSYLPPKELKDAFKRVKQYHQFALIQANLWLQGFVIPSTARNLLFDLTN